MKKFNIAKLLSAAVLALAAIGITSCGQQEPTDPEAPSLLIEYGENEPLSAVTVPVGADKDTVTVAIISSYEWKVRESSLSEDITVSPKTGHKGETNVKIAVGATLEAREIVVEFNLKEYASPTATLTIDQAAPGPIVSDILYFEDAGSGLAAMAEAEENPAVDIYTGWSRQSPFGLSQSAVSYSGAASVRNTGTDSSQDGFSGYPNIFMNSDNGVRREFVFGPVETGGHTDLIFMAAGIASKYPDFIPLTSQMVEFWAGYDGEQWAKLPVDSDDSNSYSWVSAEFAVAEGTQRIYLKIATLDNQIRWDDLTLASGGQGSLIEPPVAPEKYFSVTPAGELEVGAEVQGVQFAVESNVEWSVLATGQGGEDIGIDTPAGNGDGTVTVTFGENVSVNGARYFTVEFSTVDERIPESGRTREFTIEQYAAEARSFSVAATGPLEIDAQTGGAGFAVESDVDWSVACLNSSDSNFHIDPETGSEDGTVTLFFGENENTESARYFVIEFSTADVRVPESDRKHRFTVDQSAAEKPKYFSVTPLSELDIAHDVTNFQFAVSSNVDWVAYPTEVTVSVYVDHESGSGDGTVKVSFYANSNTNIYRRYTIEFATADEGVPEAQRSYEFTINQAPAPVPVVWEQVSSLEGITAGDYIIAFRHDENGKYYSLPVAKKASNPVAREVSVGEDGTLSGVIGSGSTPERVDDSVIWRFTGSNDGGFTVESAKEQPKTFLESKNEAQGIKITETPSTNHTWSFGEDFDNGLLMKNIGISATRSLAVFISGSGEPTWRYYNMDSNYKGELVLFKSVEAIP